MTNDTKSILRRQRLLSNMPAGWTAKGRPWTPVARDRVIAKLTAGPVGRPTRFAQADRYQMKFSFV